MEVLNQDDHSDISETVKEQYKELVDSLQNKNKQIARLLADIQELENENTILMEKVTNLRDELSFATNDVNVLTDKLNDTTKQIYEFSEEIKKLSAENENFQDEAREALEDKQRFERELEEFTDEFNRRVDECKRILDDNDRVIQELKAQRVQSSLHSSLSSLPQDRDDNQQIILNKILLEREQQVLELKTQLQQAVKDMDDTTVIIKDLTNEKEINENRITDLTDSVNELKKQLNKTHERCQELQEILNYTEQIVIDKDNEIKEILGKLRKSSKIDLDDCLEEIQTLKADNSNQQKQIIDLVKLTNKLQNNCDRFEQENQILREKLGLKIDETIDRTSITIKQKKQKKELITIRKQMENLVDENLELKTKIHEQNRKIATLSDSNLKQIDELPESKDEDYSNELKNLIEENEALRRGLHEILDSINKKKKSETLAELLLEIKDFK